jgi:cell division protein FtsI (penicillin-binding protein 3)
MFFVFLLAFGGIIARLFVLQIVEAPAYAKIAANQRERDIEFPAGRGSIFDRGGEPLAISVDLQMIFADPSLVEDVPRTAAKLSPLLDVPVPELEKKLRSYPGNRFEILAHQVLPKTASKVKSLLLPGIAMESEPKRFYPGGRLAGHVLGFVNLDGSVRAGMEAQYESILEGKAGHMTLEQDPSGRPLPQAEFSYQPPTAGRSLFLTIDKELQYFTEQTLAEATQTYHAASGTAIIMRPGTGEILALANVPDYDPNHPGNFEQDALRNRAVTDVYEPGSAFKLVTLAGALESGVVTPKTKYDVPDQFQYSDRLFHDSHAHPPERMTVSEIIQQSSNVGTIKIGLDLGGEKLTRFIKKFGFGRETGLDFPGESPGIVLPRAEWSGSTIATIPIGQGIAVTPMQMVTAYAAVANGGVWVEPKLLDATMDGSGKQEPSSPPSHRRVISEKTARQMVEILTGVVDEGTGIEAQIPGFKVAGKTGTAQKPGPGGYDGGYVGSFVGFAPAEDPAVVVMVVLDNPSPIWGGASAAPTFKKITEFALRRLGVSPSGNAEKAAKSIEAEQAGVIPAHD